MKPWTAAFGISDLVRGTPMDPAMHMRIGSVTKTMTATVLLQLMGEGALELDDLLVDVLPDQSDIPNAGSITIRQLLTMRSGIFDVLDDESIFPRIMADPTAAWTSEEMIAISATHDPVSAPGYEVKYSNTTYIPLGLIVERLTGSPIGDVLDQRLFGPLGMTETSLPSDPALPAPFSRDYFVDPTAPPDAIPAAGDAVSLTLDGVQLIDWTDCNPTAAWAAGGVVSTIDDLHIWLQKLIDGSLIPADLQRERLTFTPVERDPGEPPYGYGLGLADDNGVIGHDGSILGYHSYIGFVRETETSVIVLANLDPAKDRRDSATEIAGAIIQRLSTIS